MYYVCHLRRPKDGSVLRFAKTFLLEQICTHIFVMNKQNLQYGQHFYYKCEGDDFRRHSVTMANLLLNVDVVEKGLMSSIGGEVMQLVEARRPVEAIYLFLDATHLYKSPSPSY